MTNHNNQNGLIAWLKQNAWALIIFFGSLIIIWTTLNYKVNAMEAKLNTYPSEDYFNLKFQQIDKDLSNFGVLLQNHINNTK